MNMNIQKIPIEMRQKISRRMINGGSYQNSPQKTVAQSKLFQMPILHSVKEYQKIYDHEVRNHQQIVNYVSCEQHRVHNGGVKPSRVIYVPQKPSNSRQHRRQYSTLEQNQVYGEGLKHKEPIQRQQQSPLVLQSQRSNERGGSQIGSQRPQTTTQQLNNFQNSIIDIISKNNQSFQRNKKPKGGHQKRLSMEEIDKIVDRNKYLFSVVMNQDLQISNEQEVAGINLNPQVITRIQNQSKLQKKKRDYKIRNQVHTGRQGDDTSLISSNYYTNRNNHRKSQTIENSPDKKNHPNLKLLFVEDDKSKLAQSNVSKQVAEFLEYKERQNEIKKHEQNIQTTFTSSVNHKPKESEDNLNEVQYQLLLQQVGNKLDNNNIHSRDITVSSNYSHINNKYGNEKVYICGGGASDIELENPENAFGNSDNVVIPAFINQDVVQIVNIKDTI